MTATSAPGLKRMSIRDDEVAAQTLGINTTWYKVGAFVLSAFFPGMAGAIYARQIGYIDPLTVLASSGPFARLPLQCLAVRAR